MRVLQVVPRINDEASGPSYSVPALCDALVLEGADVSLRVLEPATDSPHRSFELQAYAALPFFSHRLGFSPTMRRDLAAAAADSDILHNHSLWMMPNVYAGTSGGRSRLVTSPRGVFSRWALARSSWRKRVMWWAMQRHVVENAACLHATAEAEYEDIRRAGFRKPVAIIPNGVSIPALVQVPRPSGRRRLLFLGRIHPVKGVDDLLLAWREVQDHFNDWELHVVGPATPHSTAMRALASKLGAERVSFTGARYGTDKSHEFLNAELFVLPSRSENFGMAVAEALAHGRPAIVSRGAPWGGLESEGCGWWVAPGVEPLAAALHVALSRSPEELHEKGERGRRWMTRDFAWTTVAHKMMQMYRWILEGGDTPEFVRVG